jgi:hypothetical protein
MSRCRMIRGSIESFLIFHTVIPEGKRGFESGPKVKGRDADREKGKIRGILSVVSENIDTFTIRGDPEC